MPSWKMIQGMGMAILGSITLVFCLMLLEEPPEGSVWILRLCGVASLLLVIVGLFNLGHALGGKGPPLTAEEVERKREEASVHEELPPE